MRVRVSPGDLLPPLDCGRVGDAGHDGCGASAGARDDQKGVALRLG